MKEGSIDPLKFEVFLTKYTMSMRNSMIVPTNIATWHHHFVLNLKSVHEHALYTKKV